MVYYHWISNCSETMRSSSIELLGWLFFQVCSKKYFSQLRMKRFISDDQRWWKTRTSGWVQCETLDPPEKLRGGHGLSWPKSSTLSSVHTGSREVFNSTKVWSESLEHLMSHCSVFANCFQKSVSFFMNSACVMSIREMKSPSKAVLMTPIEMIGLNQIKLHEWTRWWLRVAHVQMNFYGFNKSNTWSHIFKQSIWRLP